VKCISKYICILLSLIYCLALTGCGSEEYSYSYSEAALLSSFHVHEVNVENQIAPFASNLVVSKANVNKDTVDVSQSTCALLFDLKAKNPMLSKNIYDKMNPASLTKILTALVAVESGSLDMVLTATTNSLINESGAQVVGLKVGDTMTLEQALNILLVYSANDVAMLIAEGVGGNVASFVDMMNEKAKSIGATGTHYVNPHGLTEEDHYTTAYDLYLMFNEAVKHEKIVEIIQKTSYQTVIHDKNGKEKNISVETTNRYLSGAYKAPANVAVIGGKTGTTKAAGSCLMLYAKDINGNPYISVILQSESRDTLYAEMTDLLGEIAK